MIVVKVEFSVDTPAGDVVAIASPRLHYVSSAGHARQNPFLAKKWRLS
jgi:hypothetical protein